MSLNSLHAAAEVAATHFPLRRDRPTDLPTKYYILHHRRTRLSTAILQMKLTKVLSSASAATTTPSPREWRRRRRRTVAHHQQPTPLQTGRPWNLVKMKLPYARLCTCGC